MNKKLLPVLLAVVCTGMVSCKKEDNFNPTILPSDGKVQSLNGGPGGANARNSVFLDLSSDRQDSANRAGWDLGFYCGNEFRVILNYTASAGAKVTTKTDLAQVGAADTVGLTLAVNHNDPQPTEFAYFDAISGNIHNTLIPEISANSSDNKVIILNRGTGGGIAARPWMKLKINRSANGGYVLQYARITETNFQTVEIPKDAAYNFNFVSLNNGALVKVEPKKAEWDIVWTYSLNQTSFGAGMVPYNFSDLVAINTMGGVQAAKVMTSVVSYADYKLENVATTSFSSDRWVIGGNWRLSSPTAASVYTDRFFVVKDGAGNVYKLKFVSFHANDGGVRGYPVVEYKLVK